MIAQISQPKDRVLIGWGRPGTPYEGIQFRIGILDTVKVLGSHAVGSRSFVLIDPFDANRHTT